jgi:metal-sulfur cluster biosynthetic enzyme
MGFVRDVAVGGEPGAAIVRVVLCVTDTGCVMGGPFAQQAYERISRLPGVAEADVEFDATAEWTPEDMSPAYAARLHAVREQRVARHRARGRDVVLLPVIKR